MTGWRTQLRTLLRKVPIERLQNPPPVVAVLRLSGVIGSVGIGRGGLTLARLAGPIARAFAPGSAAAVALVINSPGGSAVQSSLIAGRIRAHAEETGIPVLAFVEDIAASGGYWLACAADEIHADESSILGSIGVISAGFGFQDLLARVGVERRVHTAGERKSFLDPFRPEAPEDVARLRALQEEIHGHFQDWVVRRRGGRLKAPEGELFTGEFWTGRRAAALGLADGIGDMRGVLRARFGEKVRVAPMNPEPGWLRRRLGLPAAAGDWPEGLIDAVAARALWARYGL